MTASAGSGPVDAPRHLVVVGAASGMGRWLVEHLLLQREWEDVLLVDARYRDAELAAAAPSGTRCVAPPPGSSAGTLGLDRRGTVVLLAVPLDALAEVTSWLVPQLADDAELGVVSANQAASIDAVAGGRPRSHVFGVHPLFDASARSAEGQTFLVVRDAGSTAGDWIAELIADAGAITDSGTPSAHDAIMTYVQTMTHQALVGFADAVSSSGLDLQNVWEARTPVFEALFGLAARVLAERQQSTIAGIQVSMNGERAADELAAAASRWRDAVATASPAEVEHALSTIRDRFSGTLFDTIQATAASAVTAAQSKRAELARHRRTGRLVGIRPLGRDRALRVGRIVEVTPVSVTLREVMLGQLGGAALIEGPGRHNAGRLGLNGSPTETVFGLGHVDVVHGAELEAALDEWLAFVRRDVRFLVPESVAGVGVLEIVTNQAGVRDASVVSEVVRTGQRAVAVRMHIRADHDVDDMVEALRARVQATYVWPAGLSLATAATHVHFLGPHGTFSETAAKQARTEAGRDWIILEPQPDFPAVLGAIGDDQLGVLPISSSASGLVTRSVRALLEHPRPLAFGGVVDVAVRIDAHVAEGRQLADLKGSRVLSHPQALGQCENFIRRWQLVPEPCSSTAEALQRIVTDPDAVALAGPGFDLPAGVRVAEREVDDLSGSITRFLILGGAQTFGELAGGSAPTLRSLWVGESVAAVLPMIEPGEPAFDELLTDADGRVLWVTSRVATGDTPPGARYLGRAPWSPRTPVVRVEVDVPS